MKKMDVYTKKSGYILVGYPLSHLASDDRLQADSLGRTNSCACATLDALVSIDYIDVAGRNSLNRTLIDASTASDTRI